MGRLLLLVCTAVLCVQPVAGQHPDKPAVKPAAKPPVKAAPAPAAEPAAEPAAKPAAKNRRAERLARALLEAQEQRRVVAPTLPLADNAAIPDLIEGLAYNDATVRRAVELLMKRGPAARAAMPTMARLLEATKSRSLQLVLIDGLLAIDPLHQAACGAHHDRICNGTLVQRRAAALALGALGAAAKPALRAMISATREDDVGLVRDAVTGLGMLGATAQPAVRRLRELLRADDHGLAARAAIALRQIAVAIERERAR